MGSSDLAHREDKQELKGGRMAYRKTTLRKLPPQTRQVAKLVNDLDSVARRLKNRMPAIERLELDSIALFNRGTAKKQGVLKPTPAKLFDGEDEEDADR